MRCDKCGLDHGKDAACPAAAWPSLTDSGTGEFSLGHIPRPVSMRQPPPSASPTVDGGTAAGPSASGDPLSDTAPPPPPPMGLGGALDPESEQFMNEFKRFRREGFVPLAILGASEAGKTVMLTRLYEHLTRFSGGRLDQAARMVYQETAEMFQNNISLLESNRWPPPTDQNRRFIYAFLHGKRKFMFVDLSGHDFESISSSAKHNRLYHYLRECQGYLYLLDATKLLGPARWKLQGFFQAFINFLTNESVKTITNPLVVAFSKADELPGRLMGRYRRQKPFTLAHECVPEMAKLVAGTFRNHKFAYLSCAGKRTSEITGFPVPVAGETRPPYGLDDCLNYLLETPRNARGWSTNTICRFARLLGREY